MSDELDAPRIEAQLAALGDVPPDAPARLDLELKLAWAIFIQERARAESLSRAALEHAGDDIRLRGFALRNLAYGELLRGDYAKSMPLAREAIAAFEAVDEAMGKSTALDIATHCLEGVGDYPRALEAAVEGLEIARAHDRKREMAWGQANLASIHTNTGDLVEGERCYHEALETFEGIDYGPGVARVKSALGSLYEKMGKDPEALDHHRAALDRADTLELPNLQARSLMNIGTVLDRMGRKPEALERFEAAATLYEANGVVVQRARVEIRRGSLLCRLDRADEARRSLDVAIRLIEGAGASPDLLDAHRTYATLSDNHGTPEDSAHHWRRAHDVLAEVMDDERRAAFDRIKTRLEIERAEVDAELYRLRYVELAEMQAQLVESERMAVVGDLAAGLAHEINTPMGVIRANVDVARRAATKVRESLPAEADLPKVRKAILAMESSLVSSVEAGDRIIEMVQSLKRFAKLDEAAQKTFNVAVELQGVLSLVRPKVAKTVELVAELHPVPDAEGFPSELNQAFMTILVNATEATQTGTIRVRTDTEGESIRVDIEDTGPGMGPETLGRLFEPGFTKAGHRVRFRVGLPTAATTVRRHGGQIEVDSTPGEGTRFTIRLPRRSGSDDGEATVSLPPAD